MVKFANSYVLSVTVITLCFNTLQLLHKTSAQVLLLLLLLSLLLLFTSTLLHLFKIYFVFLNNYHKKL